MTLSKGKVRSLYTAGSHRIGARELARYKLDIVDVPEGVWGKEGMVKVGD